MLTDNELQRLLSLIDKNFQDRWDRLEALEQKVQGLIKSKPKPKQNVKK